jgi:hypothetical protein
VASVSVRGEWSSEVCVSVRRRSLYCTEGVRGCVACDDQPSYWIALHCQSTCCHD